MVQMGSYGFEIYKWSYRGSVWSFNFAGGCDYIRIRCQSSSCKSFVSLVAEESKQGRRKHNIQELGFAKQRSIHIGDLIGYHIWFKWFWRGPRFKETLVSHVYIAVDLTMVNNNFMGLLQHCEEMEQGFMFSGIKDSYDS